MGEPVNYAKTIRTCYLSSCCMSVIVNLPPLLFVLLSGRYGINLERLGRLILINFFTQLIVDGIAARLADRIGYRRCLVAAHLLAALGLIGYGLLPQILPTGAAYAGLCLATVVFSVGGGLIEVLVSPVVDRLTGHLGAGPMALLHSCYCWGQVATVLLSTLALRWMPERLWYLLPLCWAVLPIVATRGFASAPLPETHAEKSGANFARLLRTPRFWLAFATMAFSGAAEIAMAQWSSLFAEWGIGVDKLTGDLLGPCLFGLCMAAARTVYGKFENKFPLRPFLFWGGAACVACYLAAGLSGNPALALFACALTGMTVALMWPGTLHESAQRFPEGGTALFGLLALGGDAGCAAGPWLLGLLADRGAAKDIRFPFGLHGALPARQRGLRLALLAGTVFPLGFLVCVALERHSGRGEKLRAAEV